MTLLSVGLGAILIGRRKRRLVHPERNLLCDRDGQIMSEAFLGSIRLCWI